MNCWNIGMSTTIMVTVGAFGFFFNSLAMFVIYRNPVLHNTFGMLCFSHLISNLGVLLCFTTWPIAMILKYNQDNDISHNSIGKRVGQIMIFFWYTCLFSHVAISLNRFISIAYPVKSMQFFTVKNTFIALSIIWIISFIVIIPYFKEETCYIAFNALDFHWQYSEEYQCGRVLSLFDFISGVVMCIFSFTTDMCTLSKLRLANNIMATSGNTVAEMHRRRKNEIRLFSQAFTQCIVFCITLLSFHVFVLISDNLWWKFATVTMVWIANHSVDGLIVVLFHFRVSLFKEKPSSLATPSSKFFTSNVTGGSIVRIQRAMDN